MQNFEIGSATLFQPTSVSRGLFHRRFFPEATEIEAREATPGSRESSAERHYEPDFETASFRRDECRSASTTLKLVLQGETLQQCKKFLAHCCILTTSGHSHPLLKITTTFNNVRFQKKMRLVSLEIPEPGATGYQNLMRQNSKLTRSDATRSTLRPKCPITAEEIEAGKRVR
jgi:hypothetical protein